MWIVLGVVVVVAGGAAAFLMRGRSESPPARLVAGERYRGTGKIVAIGELHTAPLSDTACVHWEATVRIAIEEHEEAEPDPHDEARRMVMAARVVEDASALVLLRTKPKQDQVPMKTHHRYASSVFAVDVLQGRIVLDSEDAEVTAPPLELARDFARESALLEEWHLGRWRKPPPIRVLALRPGDTVDVSGVLERDGDDLRLAREVTLALRR